MLAGFEREWSRKDLGVRTFALTALLVTLSSMISARSHWARWEPSATIASKRLPGGVKELAPNQKRGQT
jgi:uncharacterized membrane protein YhiD involved in acid resistance